jgi:hypothetical protein
MSGSDSAYSYQQGIATGDDGVHKPAAVQQGVPYHNNSSGSGVTATGGGGGDGVEGGPPARRFAGGGGEEGFGSACCCCFADGPVDDDPNGHHTNTVQTTMCRAPCEQPGDCLLSCFCPCCMACDARSRVLDGDHTQYQCCQGYVNICCFKAGCYGEDSCPTCCMCVEAFCCLSCAVSSSRLYLMDKYQLLSDPCDRRLIRFNNCLQLASCICDIVAIFVAGAENFAKILDLIAEIVFCVTQACMQAQLRHELDYRSYLAAGGVAMPAPPSQKMA